MKSPNKLFRIISQLGLKPIPKTSVSEWADTYRIVSDGARPGRWRTSNAPYQKEIMDAFTQPGVRRVVAKTASQVGKSDIMNNVIGRFAHIDPAAIMMIQPSIDMAEDYSKSRIAPMIRDTKVLRNLFYDVKAGKTAKTRDSNNTILSKIFPGGRLIMCGANSPAGLASRPIRVLLADEVDRFPDSAGTEGDPVELAAKRMTTFWNRVMGLFSTPTNEGASRIETEYHAGTQEEWQHACPNCGEYHLITYRDIETEHEEIVNPNKTKTVIVKSVKWRCPDCGHAYGETAMKQAKQKYVPQNPSALSNGCRSFFVNCFAPLWIEWAEVMREWLEAKGDPEREKVIVNTRFGETYRQVGKFSDEQVFLKRRHTYEAELPDGVLLLTAAVDVQDNRLEYEICGWGVGEENWGIKKSVILGSPTQEQTWEELDQQLDRTYYFRNGNGLKVLRTFIDSGYCADEVYKYCRSKFALQRFAIKGMSGPGLPLYYKISPVKKYSIPLVILGVDSGKQYVMSRLEISVPGPKYFHFPLDHTPGDGAKVSEVLMQRGYDEIYFKGLIAEQLVMRKRGGIVYQAWENIAKDKRNEPFDLRVYNLACMQSIKPNWEALQQLIGAPRREKIAEEKGAKSAPKTSQGGRKRRSKGTNLW